MRVTRAHAQVQDDIAQQLRLRQGHARLVASFNRPNIHYSGACVLRGTAVYCGVLPAVLYLQS